MFPLIVDKMRTQYYLQVFQEFMLATDMTASGSPEEKLRWAFKMYDKDGSGCEDLVSLMLMLLLMLMLFVR